jgi:hypothetical protein
MFGERGCGTGAAPAGSALARAPGTGHRPESAPEFGHFLLDLIALVMQSDQRFEQSGIFPGSWHMVLTRLARRIYDSRPDLQRHFPDRLGKDAVKFLAWMLTCGCAEYGFHHESLHPLREQWQEVLASLPHNRSRLYYQAVLLTMRSSVTLRSGCQTAATASHSPWLCSRRWPWRRSVPAPPRAGALLGYGSVAPAAGFEKNPSCVCQVLQIDQ